MRKFFKTGALYLAVPTLAVLGLLYVLARITFWLSPLILLTIAGRYMNWW